jgi:glycosyltransferase involved in cell wall biosynthesis
MTRLAIAHDWLIQPRGAERLLREFCLACSPITIYTLFARPQRIDPAILRHPLVRSPLDRLPGLDRYYRYLLPLYRWGIERLQVRDVELLLSISHAVAKGVPCADGIPHLCYCLTPMRFVWFPQFYGPALEGSRWRRRLLRLLAGGLRRWDVESAKRVDHFVAISRTVQERIAKVYGRPSEVVHPCVDLDELPEGTGPREPFYLVVSALVPHKRLDLAVEAFNRSGRTLVVVGEGPQRTELRGRARSNIHFAGWLPDPEVRRLYTRAKALVFPGVEDFGLTPLEAQACGCPVIALGQGGVTETVDDGETGVFFRSPDPDDLNRAVERLEGLIFDPRKLRAAASRFSREEFRNRWRSIFERCGHPVAFPG